MKLVLLLTSALLLTLGNTTSAQVAWTNCQGSSIATFVNAAILATDSAQEILRHEQVHRAQAQALVDSLGACPALDANAHLQIEAQAYCASDSVRVRVKQTPPLEASAITLSRLLREFWPTISADTILATWRRTCP